MSGALPPDRNQREAQAILERVRQETEPQIGAGANGLLTRAGGHFSGADADPQDRIEVIGTRIGRLLGLAGFILLAAWLLSSLSSP